MTDAERLTYIRRVWDQAQSEIQDRFGIDAPNLQIEEVAVDGTHRFGAIRDRIFYVPADIPVEGVVSSLCLCKAMDSDKICRDCIDDFAMEFARQFLEGDARERWFKAWLEHTQMRYPDSPLSYHPSWTFRFLYRMVGEEGLNEIVREVRDLDRYEIFMGKDDYVIFLKTRLRRFVVPLNSTELKLLDHLLRDPNTAYKDISDDLKMSPQWVSKKIKDLRLRRVLRKHDRVSFSKIGIRSFHVLLGCEDKSHNLVSYLTSSPFLYKSHNMMSGIWDLEASLFVPDNRINLLALEKFVTEMEDRGIHAEALEVDSTGLSHCYDHYLLSEAGWQVPWEVMRVQLRRIYNDELADVIPRIDERSNRTNLYLDELDMRIFNLAQKGITSISRVRNRLRMAQETVAHRLKRLKDDGLIDTRYSAQNIGLIEKALIVTDDKRTGESIAAWAQRLPQASISFTREGTLYCQVWLPLGGGYGAMWALDVLPIRVTAGLLSLPAVFNYWIPHRLWDVDNQSWRHSSEALEKWFKSLDKADREIRSSAT